MCWKITDCDLQFIDAVIDEEYLLFSSWYSNGLFRLEKGKKNAEYIGDFQETAPLFLHRQVLNIAGCIYFIPYYGNGISIYDRKTGNISYIEITGVKNLCISRAYIIHEDIYMVPGNFYTPFMILHTENNKYEIVEDFWDNVSVLFSHPEKLFFDLYSSCIVNGSLYICGLEAEGMVISVNLKNWAVRYYELPKSYQIRNIYFDRERFYFVLRNQCSIVCWDYKTNRCCEYLVEGTGDLQIEHPYMTIVRWGNHLLLLPDQTDKIWEFNEKESKWQEKKEYIPESFSRRRNEGSLFVGYKVWNDKLFLFPRAGNGMLVLSEYNSTLYCIRCFDELNGMIQGKWARYINRQTAEGEILYESNITLKDMVFALPYVSSKKNRLEDEKIGRVIWDFCSR